MGLAIDNSWVRAIHTIEYGDSEKNAFFQKVPFEVSKKPDLKLLVHTWRGILSYIHEKKLDPASENKIYYEELKKFTGHKTKDNTALISNLPWLKFLMIVSDEVESDGTWIKGKSPIPTLGFNRDNGSVFSIQLHEYCNKLFGYIEDSSFTTVEPKALVGFRSYGMIEFYERCASYANMNRPWVATREELLRIFDITPEKDQNQFNKYIKWSYFRQFLQKKAVQLNKRGINITIEKITNYNKDEKGVVQVIPIHSQKIKKERILLARDSERNISGIIDQRSLIAGIKTINRQTSIWVNDFLNRVDNTPKISIVETLCTQYKISCSKIYYVSRINGEQEVSLGHLVNTVKRLTENCKLKDAESPVKVLEYSEKALAEARALLDEQIEEWANDLFTDLSDREIKLQHKLNTMSCFRSMSEGKKRRIALISITNAEKNYLSVHGFGSMEKAVYHLASKLSG